MEKVVIFHFLHGDSEINRDHGAYGWNAKYGGYTDSDPQQSSLLDTSRVREGALWASRRPLGLLEAL